MITTKFTKGELDLLLEMLDAGRGKYLAYIKEERGEEQAEKLSVAVDKLYDSLSETRGPIKESFEAEA